MGTVFARLKVPAPDGSGAIDDHGVHAFIVPLRDADSQCLPGVEIKDCGYKVGQECLTDENRSHEMNILASVKACFLCNISVTA